MGFNGQLDEFLHGISFFLNRLVEEAIHHQRNLIERLFNEIEHVRQIATRFDRRAANVVAAVTLAATRAWLRTYESRTWPTPWSLALDQQAKWDERANRHQVVGDKVRGRERQRIQRRFGLFDRLDGHEKNWSDLLSKPELLDLAIKIELKRRRHFARHVLLPLFWCEGFDGSDGHDLHE
ncbi:MAG TPA: hypothetical protein VGA15_11405 [Bradyrhizobium sp.]